MKGQVKVRVEVTDEMGHFPITESWEYTRDNTLESMDDWIGLFNKVLAVQGFSGTLEDYFGEDNGKED